MGDMADRDFDNANWEEEIDWQAEQEEEERRAKRIPKTCRICGQTGLFWDQYEGKWRLHDKDDNLHDCQKKTDPPKSKRKIEPLVKNEYMEFPFSELRGAVAKIRQMIRSKEHLNEYDFEQFTEAIHSIADDLARGHAVQEFRIRNEI